VASWLDARAAGGRWLLRIEDVDAMRTVPGAEEEIVRVLRACALEWDGDVARQSRRTMLYESALERLRAAGLAYRCRCSRREIADSGLAGPEGAIYPGTCRDLALDPGVPAAERLRVPRAVVEVHDRVQGRIAQDIAADIGDFVLKRRDGLHAYQLAAVVDDAAQGVTDVVRGADLLWSTPRQVLLQRSLGLRTPRYLHVPVAANARGEKLSKQTMAAAIGERDATQALRAALRFLGQPVPAAAAAPAILAAATLEWDPVRIPRVAAVWIDDRPPRNDDAARAR
jgi:glutamyl-Q tRNA(Asp) synthetase